MNDIVERLRSDSRRMFPLHMRDGHNYHATARLCDAAADEIATLRERVAELEGALNVGERFLSACNSAWAAGEPKHRVKTMLDLADEFRSALSRPNDGGE